MLVFSQMMYNDYNEYTDGAFVRNRVASLGIKAAPHRILERKQRNCDIMES